MAVPDVVKPDPPKVHTSVSVVEVHAEEAMVTVLKFAVPVAVGVLEMDPPAAVKPVMTTVIVSAVVNR
jgi:hypothetical protein